MRQNAAFIARYIRKQKWRYALAIILMVCSNGIVLTMIAVQQVIVDDLLIKGRADLYVPVLALFAGLILANFLLSPAALLVIVKNEFRGRKDIAGDLLAALHRMPIGKLQKERSARYLQLMTDEVSTVAFSIFKTFVFTGVGQSFRLITLATYIGLANPLILAVVLALSVIYFFMVRYFSPKVKAAAKAVQQTRADLMVQIEEGISASREIVAFHRTEWEQRTYNSRFDTYFSKVIAEGKLQNKHSAASEPLIWAIQLVMLLIGGMLVIKGSLALGVFIVTIQFAPQLMNAVHFLFKFILELSGTMARVERIRELMESDSIDEGTERMKGPITSLSLNEVSFRYGEEYRSILNRISLDVPIGKKTAFVGASGGGKSTIAQLFIRFYDPQSGWIAVNGVPLQRIRRSDWSSRVAIVFQEPYLFPDTIRNNLRFGRSGITDNQMMDMCRAMLIHDFIVSLPEGYDTEIGERGILLSGGQRQRIALARGLLGDPELLILDEATSALDLQSERIVQQHIDEMRRGKTTIIIAHRLSTVKNADVLFVIENGQVVEQGSHDELLTRSGLYTRIVQERQEEGVIA